MNLTDAMLKTLYDRLALLEARVAQLEMYYPVPAVPTTFAPSQITAPWPPFADPTRY